ncbi:ADP-ribosylglycohydrolase family protein [Glaciibacter psychrotolerans]|uniref:ADP-ribosylglycohydrolase n=1 Tax=Glaciibacter psychrotolerans TaxID=670054 RepID=A0A7Z0EHJ0_9MICO|nr:ADP-ribosylglycohydrolase family protein [Leifsonia psychrotolerans]NYJ20969.1 ADP-ribosylglycohydrolase [Leifsonia psychrotolerans]
MSLDDPWNESVTRLFSGIVVDVEKKMSGRVNVDKWLDPIVGRERGRDLVARELALFLEAAERIVTYLPGCTLSVVDNDVSVSIADRRILTASFGFYRLRLSEKIGGREVAIGSFSQSMGVKAFLWRLAVTHWGDAFERKFALSDPRPVVRSESGMSFLIHAREGEGPHAEVWEVADALSFARGCARDVDVLLDAARQLAARGNEVTRPLQVSLADRIQGCLIGGAVGDALGYPVEFSTLDSITARVGPAGVREFLAHPGAPLGAVSDDTQMTLFTADALTRRTGDVSVRSLMVDAYRDWHVTQTTTTPATAALSRRHSSPVLQEPWLFAQRAPGLTIMAALQAMPENASVEVIPDATNQSKGCGTVMRSAPFGLVPSWTPEEAYEHAAQASAITHGHPTAHIAAGALALLIRHLVAGQPLSRAVAAMLAHVVSAEPDGLAETSTSLHTVAEQIPGIPDHPDVEGLGAGWVAEEALAIAVYCALIFPERDQVENALSLAVTHSGDSDSTGSICGNILGALHGIDAIPERWRNSVEGRDTILAVANTLAHTN